MEFVLDRLTVRDVLDKFDNTWSVLVPFSPASPRRLLITFIQFSVVRRTNAPRLTSNTAACVCVSVSRYVPDASRVVDNETSAGN